MTSRTIFIGDPHGCLTEFLDLLWLLELKPEDQIVCLGDMMDKGPYPAPCLAMVYAASYHNPNFRSIKGNHEERHVRWRRHWEKAQVNPTYLNPMKRPMTPEDQAANLDLDLEVIGWMDRLPITLEPVNGWLAVHGGLRPNLPLKDQPADEIIRLRLVDQITGKHIPTDYENGTPPPEGAVHWAEVYDGSYNVVYGHEAHSLSKPRVDHRPQGVTCYGIDTGVVHGGHLTALVLEGSDVSFVQVKARDVYMKPPHGPIPD